MSKQAQRSGLQFCCLLSLLLSFLLLAILAPSPATAATCDVALTKSITTVSPNTGLVLWPSSKPRTDYKNAIALEFSYFHINDIVNANKDTYDWSVVEDFLTDISNNGHSAVVRFIYEDPNTEKSTVETFVPQFIKNTPGYSENSVNYVYDESTKPQSTRVVKMADWSSQTLRDFHLEFFTKVAARYDADPRIAYLQVGFGWWCEYHLFNPGGDGHIVIGKTFPTWAFQKQFLQLIQTQFTLTPYSISIDAYSDQYTEMSTDTTTSNSLTFGLFDDSFMNKEHEIVAGDEDVGYNEQSWIGLGAFSTTPTDRRLTGPSGGEVSYYTPADQRDFLLPGGIYGRTFKSQATKYELTYMIANDAPSTKISPAVFLENSIMMGYSFSVELIKFNRDKKTISITVKNTGIASSFHPYRFEFKVSDTVTYTSADIVKLAKDTSVVVDMTNIDFTIVDAFFTAQTAAAANDWLVITSPKVASTSTVPYSAACDKAAPCTTSTDCASPLICEDGECINGAFEKSLHSILVVICLLSLLSGLF